MSITVVGISGSLRRDSYNTKLLKAAQKLMPDGASLELCSIADIPLYNADNEQADGIPKAVEELKKSIIGSDGFLIATPEYNNSIPGVTKNAMDWLSRPPEDIKQVFGGRPAAIVGATPGNFGTILAQDAWLPVMRTLGVKLWTGGRLMAPRAAALFDEQGQIVDESVSRRLESYLAAFVEFIKGS